MLVRQRHQDSETVATSLGMPAEDEGRAAGTAEADRKCAVVQVIEEVQMLIMPTMLLQVISINKTEIFRIR